MKSRFQQVIRTEDGFYFMLCGIGCRNLRHFTLPFVSLHALICVISCTNLPHFTSLLIAPFPPPP
ncbi:MAG: hypothetical protein HXO14_00140 [Prevotella salivae]|nr:hypothetical protein [Segatella salivae]